MFVVLFMSFVHSVFNSLLFIDDSFFGLDEFQVLECEQQRVLMIWAE